MVFWKFAFREVITRPGRAVLTLLSIVIGVAAVVSVSIATTTTRRAYQDMFAAVAGRAALEVTADGGGRCKESLAAVVQGVPGVEAAVPVIQEQTVLGILGRRVALLAIGIDPEKDQGVRDYELSAGCFFDDGEGVVLEKEFARSLDIQPGDEASLSTSDGLKTVTVTGLVSSRGVGALRLAGLVFVPLKKAQQWFHAKGRVDAIQVVLEESADEQAVAREIARRLPVGTSVHAPASRTQRLEENLRSSDEGLRLATAFSLLLAVFIILNTFLMNVGERRQKLAILRAIGATRRQISRLLLGESLVMGALGTVLGILVGLLGAHLLTKAMNSLLLATLPPLIITPLPLVLAALFGMGVAVLGAIIPARRAGRVSPLEGMGGVAREDIEGTSQRFTLAGLIVCLAGGAGLTACIVGWLSMEFSVYSAVLLLLGAVLLLPTTLGTFSSAVVWSMSPLLQAEARLAHKQILRHRTRTALTVGVLFVASSTGIGLANAILDNVRDVRVWRERVIVADFFVRVMMPDMATGASAPVPETLAEELRDIPGIIHMDTIRNAPAEVVLDDGKEQAVSVIVREFPPGRPMYFDLKSGDINRVRDRLFEGQVVIGTVLAQRTGLKLGDQLPLKTDQGVQRLPIAGVANEYMAGGLAVHMQRRWAEEYLHVEGVEGYIIDADAQALGEVQARLQPLCDKHGVLLVSCADVSRMIDGMVKGIDGCLWGILVLGFVVAAFGVLNTLTMNVLEQTRELGLLRIVAMTRGQVRKTIFTQAAIIGGIGLGPGTLAGIVVAYLINLATMPALGHPVEFVFHPLLLVTCFVGALAMVVAAAWLPAERAARLELMQALHYE